jgi:F-box protein 21
VKAADQTPKQVHRRTGPGLNGGCKYKVGQVFRHRRYNYTAVIIGWDLECEMDNTWIVHNRVDSLVRGRHQGFYHAL